MDSVCFVIMPFGQKRDEKGNLVDFDAIYAEVVAPAIAGSGMIPLRADKESTSGIIHRDMFERLILCDYAVVDITSLNANVYYELGIRHAVRQNSTVVVGSGDMTIPFDIAPLRISTYSLAGGMPSNSKKDSEHLQATLRQAVSNTIVDSPVFQLIDLPAQDISRLKTDAFRQQSEYDALAAGELSAARSRGSEAVKSWIQECGDPSKLDAGVATDAMLSLRATGAWRELVEFSGQVSPEIAASSMFIEQRCLALARTGDYIKAAEEMEELIEKEGTTSERGGILGGIYKRHWQAEENRSLADSYLRSAIEAYHQGFLCDWRDAYPGLGYLTLSFIAGLTGEEYKAVFPVVRFAVERRLQDAPDFWDYVAVIELDALEGSQSSPALAKAISLMREGWEGESAAGNLSIIKATRKEQGLETLPWLADCIEALEQKAEQLP